MSLPHHYNRDPIPLTRLLRWLARLPRRGRCFFLGHWWRPYDLLSDECLCCGARRTLPTRGLHRGGDQ